MEKQEQRKIVDLTPGKDKFVFVFDYSPPLVAAMKALPGRRFDSGSKNWMVPVAHREAVLAFAKAHGFELSAQVAGQNGRAPGVGAIHESPVEDPLVEDLTLQLLGSLLIERAKKLGFPDADQARLRALLRDADALINRKESSHADRVA